MHYAGNAGDEVGRLLPDLGRLVVEAPEDGTTDLREIGLHPRAQCIHHNTKPIQHDYVLQAGGGDEGREGGGEGGREGGGEEGRREGERRGGGRERGGGGEGGEGGGGEGGRRGGGEGGRRGGSGRRGGGEEGGGGGGGEMGRREEGWEGEMGKMGKREEGECKENVKGQLLPAEVITRGKGSTEEATVRWSC